MICIVTYQSPSLLANGKKHIGYAPFAKFGEAICKNKLVNFLKDDEHKKCTCSSLYDNVVI